MKTTYFKLALLGCAAALYALALPLHAADSAVPSTSEITRSHLLGAPLLPVGAELVPDGDTQRLLQIVRNARTSDMRQAVADLERLVSERPNSPWTPSIRASLGHYYAERARFTAALGHWESAWQATKDLTDRPGRKVADYTLVQACHLLAKLGKADELGAFLAQAQGRLLVYGNWRQSLASSARNYLALTVATDVGFRCGIYALQSVGQELGMPSSSAYLLRRTPSPSTGLSLAQLSDLAREAGLQLAPVHRGAAQGLVTPAIIHWKIGHYAALLEQKGGLYRVVDPAFPTHRWIAAEDIADETSGYLLVPNTQIPAGWRAIDAREARGVLGRGVPYGANDDDDGCGNGSGGDGAGGEVGSGGTAGGSGGSIAIPGYVATSGPGSPTAASTGPVIVGLAGGAAGAGIVAGDGPGSPSSGQSCPGCGSGPSSSGGEADSCSGCAAGPPGGMPGFPGGRGGDGWTSAGGGGNVHYSTGGMPVWRVSEPYVNLWLSDEPMAYQSALGGRVSFQLVWKQRETNPTYPDETIFNLGWNWTFSWRSFVQDGGPSGEATVTLPDGSKRLYTPDGQTVHFFSHTTLLRATDQNNLTGFKLRYANGAEDRYEWISPWHSTIAFLTARVDPQGHALRLYYTDTNNVIRLQTVIDADGRTNSLYYDDPSLPDRVTSVRNPSGNTVYLQYGSGMNSMLTNIVDVVGLTNSVVYDDYNLPATLTTPYGVTTFELRNTGPGPGENRSVRVIDPVGATNVFMLRGDGGQVTIGGTPYPTFLAESYSETWPDQAITNTMELDQVCQDCYFRYRHTFRWWPRHAGELPANLDEVLPAQFLKARTRHWLHNGAYVGQCLDMEQAPSPDGSTLGQRTWFDYDGKPYVYASGTSSLPSRIARVLPDGTTWYQCVRRDEWGRPTNVVETFSAGYGAPPELRTNQFIYAANGIDLAKVVGPKDTVVHGYAYDAAHNLLRHTNALGDVAYYTYDTAGRLTSARSFAGLTRTNIYFPSGGYTNWVQTTIDLEIGRTNSFTYTNGLVRTFTDERGLTVTNTWDALNRLLRTDYPDGTFTTNYYAKLDLARTVDRMGFPTTFGYDGIRRLTARTNALGYFTLYNYCSCGGLGSVQDALGNYTSFSYDGAGRRTQVQYADQYVVTLNLNSLGQATNVADNAGYSVTNWFNNQGLSYAASNRFGQIKRLVFDVEDRVTTNTDANGVTLRMSYDDLGRLLTRTYPDNGVERFGYSPRGLIAYTNQLNLTNFYAYDEAARKRFETNANWEITEFQYDSSGNLTNLIDAKLQKTTWKYDIYGRVTNKLDHLSTNLFFYAYDPNGRLTNRTSAAKGSTVYKFDPLGNLTNIAYPVSHAITLAYDPLGRVTNMVDAIGSTRYDYNSVGQLLAEDGPWDADTVSNTYDHRLLSGTAVQHPSGFAWYESFLYDAAKRLTNVTSLAGPFGYTYAGVGAAPSPASLIKELALPGGGRITNAFDSTGRELATALLNAQSTVLNSHEYIYNLANQRTRQTFLSGNYVDYTYDKIGQLQTAFGKEAGGSDRVQEQLGYTYDSAGNLNWRTNNALLQSFGVNSLNELANISRSGTLTVAGTATERKSISGSPGVTSVTVSGTGLSSGAADLYTDGSWARAGATPADGSNSYTATAQDTYNRSSSQSVSVYLPASFSCAYDLNGNLLNDGRRYFEWDDENQLIAVTVSNAWRSEFQYDGKLRRRVRSEYTWSGSTWTKTNVVRYVYDGNLVIQERFFSPQLTTNIPQQTVSYVRGIDLSGTFQGAGGIGGLLARFDHSALNPQLSTSLYHCDGNGNITCLVNPSYAVAARYSYDPYGNILGQSGPLAQANLCRFSSKEWHQHSGLIYYLYRFYEPHFQRWLNKDPLGDQVWNLDANHRLTEEASRLPQPHLDNETSLFQFADNEPMLSVDPFGLSILGRLGDPNSKGKLDEYQKDCPPKRKKCIYDCTFTNKWGKKVTKQIPYPPEANGECAKYLGTGGISCVLNESATKQANQ